MKILTSKNVVACRIGDEIYVHPDLHKEEELYDAIITHEKKHSNGLNLSDVKQDLFNDELRGHKKEYYRFIKKHPSTLLGFLPITKVGKKWTIDLAMLVFAAFTIFILATLIFNLW